MRRAGASASVALTIGGLFLCWGCGSNERYVVSNVVPVKGKVTYKGKPLTKGQITFEPLDIGREAHAEISPDGSFELTTFKQGDGAVKGIHRIMISGAGRQFGSAAKNEVEVSDGKTDYTIDLK